jgi:hypothetical protein
VLGVEGTAITHPCLLLKERLTTATADAAATPWAAIPALLPCLAPRGRVSPSAAVAPTSIAVAAFAPAAVLL